MRCARPFGARSRGVAGAGPLAGIGAAALVVAARRLASIDPASAAPGGMRFQLELALLEAAQPGSRPSRRRSEDRGAVPATAAASPVLRPGRPRPRGPRPCDRRRRLPGRRRPAGPSTAPTVAGGPSPGRAAARAGAPRTWSRRPRLAPGSAAPPARPARPGTDEPLVELRRRWPEIVALISRHPPTKPLIEACRPLAVDGAVVTLGFPESQLFLRDVADRRRPTLEEGLSRVLGRPVAVRCVATNVEMDVGVPGDPEGSAVSPPRGRSGATSSSESARSTERVCVPRRAQRAGPRCRRLWPRAARRAADDRGWDWDELRQSPEDGAADAAEHAARRGGARGGRPGGNGRRRRRPRRRDRASSTSLRVEIDPAAVDPADVEMLQDLVVAAVNDALRAARELSESKMAAVTGGLRLPGM